MAWNWRSSQETSAQEDTTQPPSPTASATTSTSPDPLASLTSPAVRNATLPKKPLTRDAQAYEELIDLFASIDPDQTKRAASVAREVASRPAEELRDSLFASQMSCSQCFDMAYYCSSIGGQLNNVYRYGALRSCSDLWAQWRFCMRSKAWGEETRRMKIRDFNREKAAKYKIGKSSEDVWEVRREPVLSPFRTRPARTEDLT